VSRPRLGWRKPLLIVAALALMVATFSLGRWQLARAAEKQAVHAQALERARQSVLDGTTLTGSLRGAQTAALLHRRIALRGNWLPGHSVYLDNRVMERRTGFYVLTPLRLAGRDAVVLVQRGWAPRDLADPQSLPKVLTPPGEVQLEGVLMEQPSQAYALGTEGQGAIRQNLDLDAFRRETGLPLADLVVLQTGAPSEGLLRQWPAPLSGADKNRGYALQWFGLCALIGLLFVWFQVVRPVYRFLRAPARPHA